MTTEFIKENPTEKQTYGVLIEYRENGLVNASVLGWQNCRVTAENKQEALQKLQQLLTIHQENQEIVCLEVENSQKENPWLKFAGMFDNNPLKNEFFAEIEANSQETKTEKENLEIIELKVPYT